MQIYKGYHSYIFVGLLLAGCEGEPPAPPAVQEVASDAIICAVGGATKPEPVCKAEPGPGGYLTIRHPDGGFRRLQIYSGHISTADGSEEAKMETVDGRTVVTVGTDRYILQGSGPPKP